MADDQGAATAEFVEYLTELYRLLAGDSEEDARRIRPLETMTGA